MRKEITLRTELKHIFDLKLIQNTGKTLGGVSLCVHRQFSVKLGVLGIIFNTYLATFIYLNLTELQFNNTLFKVW